MNDSQAVPPFSWKVSVSEVTTMPCSFEEDVELYAQAGCAGIGVWGFKMEQIGPERARHLLRKHNLGVANCIPDLNSIMPYVLSPEPADPRARVEAFLPNMERMAKLEPETIVVITGPRGDRSREEAMDICLEGFERIGRAASDLGVTVALEPIHRSMEDGFTIICDLPSTFDLLKELNQPSFKILFDTWHLWDTPDLWEHVSGNIDLIGGVHISDWPKHARSWADRVFPGEGTLPITDIVRNLDAAGFKGFYDVEIFSDNGQFGAPYPDLLWRLPPEEIVDRATRVFRVSA